MFVITGGGSGLGQALALNLAKRGKNVLIIGRRVHLLEETAQHSSLIKSLCADLSTQEGINSVVSEVCEIGKINALINNAGSLQPIAPLASIKKEEWVSSFNINLNAPLFLTQKLYPQLVDGRVLNIGSGAAYFPIQGWAAYCTSKAALAMLTQCWQLESNQVSFASVMPGIIDTEMQALARVAEHMDNKQTQFYNNLKQRNQLLSTETVAEFLTWLLLDLDKDRYQSKEWDIYDTSHHEHWLQAPHQVPHWEE